MSDLKIPAHMYSKGPKNNPAPAKSWDTSGNHAYGDAELRMLKRPGQEPSVDSQELVSLTDLKGIKR